MGQGTLLPGVCPFCTGYDVSLICTWLASYGGPAKLAGQLHKSAANWTASGNLEFLNEWTYKLGEEVCLWCVCVSTVLLTVE